MKYLWNEWEQKFNKPGEWKTASIDNKCALDSGCQTRTCWHKKINKNYIKSWFLWREDQKTWQKTLGAGTITNKKLDPYNYGINFTIWTQVMASALTTALPPLPMTTWQTSFKFFALHYQLDKIKCDNGYYVALQYLRTDKQSANTSQGLSEVW